MKRMGMVIGIKPERIAEYKKTHAAVWHEVLAKISDCNMRLRQDGGRPEDAGMVGDSQAHAGPARLPQRRRLVGYGGGGLSHRLRAGPVG